MIAQQDVILKTAITLGLEDFKKNLWLVDDLLSDLVVNEYFEDKYGEEQVKAMKEWITNNQIDIYMIHRKDRDRMPCITITLGNSQKRLDYKTMADQSTSNVTLLPSQIGKPIPYIVKPFVPLNYDPSTGAMSIDQNTIGIQNVSSGMILVNPKNGQG